MSSVDRKTYMAKLRLNEMLADHDVSLPADLYDEIAAALREQPEARGVVDAVAWHVIHDDGGSHVMLAETVDDTFRAALAANGRRVRPLIYGDTRTAAQQPVQEGGGEVLARGWLHRHGPGDDYDLHDESSGAGKDCPECVPCVIVRAAPPSAPVGVEAFDARLRGRAGPFTAREGERYVDADIAQAVLREALAQKPAQAAPGDVASRQAWFEAEIASAESHWIDTMQDRFDDGDDVPGKDHFVALWLAERTPPGDDAAGGECDRCGGSGTIPAPTGSGPDQHDVDVDCPTCGGTGAFQ